MNPITLRVAHSDRDPLPAWPVSWGVPLAPGVAHDPAALRVLADGAPLPAQIEPLTRHPDGSLARLLVTAEPALPAQSEQALYLYAGQSPPAADAPATLDASGLSGAAGQLRVMSHSVGGPQPDTAPGAVATKEDGIVDIRSAVAAPFLSRAWREYGAPAWRLTTPVGAFVLTVRARGRPVGPPTEARDLIWRYDRLEPFARGPVMAGGIVHGVLLYEAAPLAHIRLTVRLFQRTPILLCDIEVKNLSPHAPIELAALELRLQREADAWREVEYEIRQLGGPWRAAPPIQARARKLAVEAEAAGGKRERASRLLMYNETWLAAEEPRGRCVVGLRDFFELYPYGTRIEPERIVVECWPTWHDRPWSLAHGCGRTHQVALAFLPPAAGYSAAAIGYAFGKPPLARVPLAEMQAAGALEELPAYEPNRYPRLETTLYDLAYNRNRGYGKMHFGDDYSALYTNQLRGAGEVVWNNLEGDYPYHMFCQYQRTGRPFYFKEFRVAIRHWADVDFRDAGPDPLHVGALVAHSADHVSGSTSPCHNWAEGFREWYFATGDPRPLEIMRLMADWLVRRDRAGFFKTEPEPYVRGCGWGLIQMAALQDVLARADLEALIRRVCADLLAYCRRHHGLPMTIPHGGNWVPRDNAFHNATVVLGTERCWRRYRDPAMRDLALAVAETFMDERTCTPEGIAVYITGPEQDFPMQQAAMFALVGLAVAWRLTRDPRYVRRGLRMLEYCLDRGLIVDHMRIPGTFTEFGDAVVLNVQPLMPNTQLLSYQLRGLLAFMRAAQEADLLQPLEYRY